MELRDPDIRTGLTRDTGQLSAGTS